MPIKEKKTCTTHTKEKEESGTCCQEKKKEKAKQQAYEHSVNTGACILGSMRNDRKMLESQKIRKGL